MDDADNAVVAYQELIDGIFLVQGDTTYGIYANRLGSGGFVSDQILVNSNNGSNLTSPSVALAPTGGQFVVAYNTGSGVEYTEMRSTTRNWRPSGRSSSRAASSTLNDASDPHVNIDGHGRYIVTYTLFNTSTNHDDIFNQHHFLS